MSPSKITINGQHYDSPDEMPPDVRRMYEAALQAIKAPQAGQPGEITQVFSSPPDHGIHASMVVNRKLVVSNRTFKSADEMPPDVRQLYDAAMKGTGATAGQSGFHVSVNTTRPEVRSFGGSNSGSEPSPVPIEPSDLESRIRKLPVSLAILILVGLILWATLGR